MCLLETAVLATGVICEHRTSSQHTVENLQHTDPCVSALQSHNHTQVSICIAFFTHRSRKWSIPREGRGPCEQKCKGHTTATANLAMCWSLITTIALVSCPNSHTSHSTVCSSHLAFTHHIQSYSHTSKAIGPSTCQFPTTSQDSRFLFLIFTSSATDLFTMPPLLALLSSLQPSRKRLHSCTQLYGA